MHAPGVHDRWQQDRGLVAFRCQRCRTVYWTRVIPTPEEQVEVHGVRYATCEEAAAAQVLGS